MVGGKDEGLSEPSELVAAAEEGTGRKLEEAPLPRRTLGYTSVNRYSGRPDGVTLSDKLTPQEAPLVLKHEIGHVIDQLAGEMPTKNVVRDLRSIYHHLNSSDHRKIATQVLPDNFGWIAPDSHGDPYGIRTPLLTSAPVV